MLQGDRHRPHDQRLGRTFFDTALEQLVQASRKTLCTCLAAPMMASVGHTLLQRQQPMHNSSETMAIFGPSSVIAERSISIPSLAAIATANDLPPGGQQAGEAEPSAISAPEQPGKPHCPQFDPGIMAISSSTSGLPSTARNLLATPRMMPQARHRDDGQTENGSDHLQFSLKRSGSRSP